jgi:hypothetical protein
MNWTIGDLRKLEGRRRGVAVRPVAAVPLGAWVEATFFLPVPVPTKKNGKGAFNERVVISRRNRLLLDEVTKAARVAWSGRRPALSNATINCVFHTTNLSQDDDGALTSTLDCLVAAGVLADDSRKHLVGGTFTHELVGLGQPEGVVIHIRGQEYHSDSLMRCPK